MFTPFLELCAVITVTVLPQVLISFYPQEMRNLLNSLPGNWRFISTLPSRMGTVLFILYIAANRLDDFHSIGLNFRDATSRKTVLIAGALTIYLLLIFIFSNLRSRKAKDQITEVQQRTLATLRYAATTNSWQKFLYFLDLWLGVIGEELVYRGYLVLMLGSQTGNLLSWGIFSISLSILVHLYQAHTWRVALVHMIFAGFFVLATVYTGSLFAALIPHLIYNTVWLMRALKTMPRQEEVSIQPSM